MMYNRQEIMLKAWQLSRKYTGLSFAECLRRAWAVAKAAPVNAQRVAAAAAAAGISEAVATWAEWKRAGYQVIHGSKALFQTELIYASKGIGAVYLASFFGASQVEAAA